MVEAVQVSALDVSSRPHPENDHPDEPCGPTTPEYVRDHVSFTLVAALERTIRMADAVSSVGVQPANADTIEKKEFCAGSARVCLCHAAKERDSSATTHSPSCFRQVACRLLRVLEPACVSRSRASVFSTPFHHVLKRLNCVVTLSQMWKRSSSRIGMRWALG